MIQSNFIPLNKASAVAFLLQTLTVLQKILCFLASSFDFDRYCHLELDFPKAIVDCVWHSVHHCEKGDKMNRGSNSRNNALIILLFAITLNVAAAHFQTANAKQTETDGDISIQESPAKPIQPTKQKIDPFTIAIIGMSLGCMCVTGAVHWNLSQRKKIVGSIQNLDSFIMNNCSVDLMLAKSSDNEPMFNTVQNLQESHRLEMVKNQDGNNEMVNRISGIEAEIMRILG